MNRENNNLASVVSKQKKNNNQKQGHVLKFLTLYSMLFWHKFFFMSLKMLSGMEKSVDPDQTAPFEYSDLGLHCLHLPFCQTLRWSKF